jgi:hypothetical protein
MLDPKRKGSAKPAAVGPPKVGAESPTTRAAVESYSDFVEAHEALLEECVNRFV